MWYDISSDAVRQEDLTSDTLCIEVYAINHNSAQLGTSETRNHRRQTSTAYKKKKKQTKQISAPDFLPCHGITIVMGRIVLIQSMEEEVGDPWRHLYQAPILTSRMAGNSISQGWTALFWIDVPLG